MNLDISNHSTLTFLKLSWADEPLLVLLLMKTVGKLEKTGSKLGHPVSWEKYRVSMVHTIKARNELFLDVSNSSTLTIFKL